MKRLSTNSGSASKAKRKRTKLRRVTEENGLTGLNPRPVPGEPYARTRKAHGLGPGTQHGVAWYRGQHAGWIDAVVALRELGMPGAARRLQKHYDMDDEGTVVLG